MIRLLPQQIQGPERADKMERAGEPRQEPPQWQQWRNMRREMDERYQAALPGAGR
jgi:hypothetical protein